MSWFPDLWILLHKCPFTRICGMNTRALSCSFHLNQDPFCLWWALDHLSGGEISSYYTPSLPPRCLEDSAPGPPGTLPLVPTVTPWEWEEGGRGGTPWFADLQLCLYALWQKASLVVPHSVGFTEDTSKSWTLKLMSSSDMRKKRLCQMSTLKLFGTQLKEETGANLTAWASIFVFPSSLSEAWISSVINCFLSSLLSKHLKRQFQQNSV